MKKKYENNQFLITLIFIYIVFIIVILCYGLNYRYRTYKVIDSIVISKNYVKLLVNTKDLSILKKSEYLYINNTKVKRRIVSIERNVLKKGSDKYHDVLINIKMPINYKENDYVKLTIYNKKQRILNIFKSCWKEEI